ncbi:hypothetical protein B0H10DRAFT_1913207 [Mycena sp. CBHHK59/15]|nr:hypothetical protein B0H10DRAFT_1913207 [Mycena sp. CBHHK59/15]
MHSHFLLSHLFFAMPNPLGINGTAPKNSPSDDVLKEALLKYTRQGQSREDQLTSLCKDFGYILSLSALRKEKIRLNIPTVRTQKLTVDELTQAVIDEVEKDTTMSRGPDFIKDQLRLKMVLAPRDSIRRIMLQYFPDGFDSRFPGRKGQRVARVPLRAHGPYFEVSADGHEKLASSALRMGSVGFSIYGYKDKYTDFVLLLKVYPDVRTSGAGGHIFLDFVEETGYIPIQLTTDKGSEVGWAYAFMSVLREIYAPDINPTLFPFHVMIKSVHNTVIEGFWRQFKEKSGLNLKDFLLRGKEGHLFNPHDLLHEPLFYWIFAPVIQAELDDFVQWWNNHRVRHQHEKIMPSGHVPSHAMDYPELFGGLDCRIKIPPEAIADLREQLETEAGPKSDFQAWPGLTEEFNLRASEVYVAIGEPGIKLANAWDVFVQMAMELSVQ